MRYLVSRFGPYCLMLALLALLPLAISHAQEAKTESTTAAATEKAGETKPAEPAAAAPAPLTVGDIKIMADTLWVMVTAMLVFFMNLGFACVESGMCRAKNCVTFSQRTLSCLPSRRLAFCCSAGPDVRQRQ